MRFWAAFDTVSSFTNLIFLDICACRDTSVAFGCSVEDSVMTWMCPL